jgi:hypothetical protein
VPGRQDVVVRGTVSRSVLLVVAGAATVGFGVFGAVTGAAGTVTYLATLVVLGLLLLRLDRAVGFSDPVAVGVTAWAVSHLAGGLIGLDGDRVLYNAVLGPPSPLRQRGALLRVRRGRGGRLGGAGTTFGRWRPGADGRGDHRLVFRDGDRRAEQVVEFAIALNVEESNIGGYLNTGQDLVANMLGAAVAGLVVVRRVRSAAVAA